MRGMGAASESAEKFYLDWRAMRIYLLPATMLSTEVLRQRTN